MRNRAIIGCNLLLMKVSENINKTMATALAITIALRMAADAGSAVRGLGLAGNPQLAILVM